MQLERLNQALVGFVSDDSVDEKTLRAHCTGYVFGELDEPCPLSFNFDPRFEALTKSKLAEQMNSRAIELSHALLGAANYCKEHGRLPQAAAVLRIAFDCLNEADLTTIVEYQHVKEQLEAIG